ncbi:hypothetical protein [Streptomyces sp. NPDC051183]|uniref:hypothetical protein n=1 Tax=unclassified Streptomyces TaxID=2593676 RepID=UPI0034308149
MTGGWDFVHPVTADFTCGGKSDLTARDGSGILRLWAGDGNGVFNRPVTPGR